jgi:lantibiotic biosynthesis protein
MNGFVLRTPLLSVREVVGLADGCPPQESGTSEGFARTTAKIRERVRGLVTALDVAEALFVASPALADSVPVWLADPLGPRGQKVERSLVKYLTRMSTRATPFGLFSGCSPGRMADRTTFTVGPRASVRRHSRLDMDYLFALTESINRVPAFRRKLRFRPNDTLVALSGRYRYVEPRVGAGSTRRYHLVAVDRSEHLDVALRVSVGGASVEALVAALAGYDPELSIDEIRAYVDDLIDSHLLVSTLQPPVTGPEPAGELAMDLRALGEDNMASRLEAAVARLERLDIAGTGHSPSEYVAILQILEALPAPVEISRLVQVDMRRPAVATLGPSVRVEIERCALALTRFGVVTDPLSSFRAAFDRRYGTTAMPLLQVLDEESGIGLGDGAPVDESPLIAGLPLGGARRGPEEAAWKPRYAWLLERLHTAWIDGTTELALTDDDMQRLYGSSSTATPPDAFSVGFTLVAPSTEAVDRGEFLLYLRGVNGPSGARILGRFCHGDPEIAEIVGQHLREEEAQESDALFAEIVHLPQGRLGNVILRPVLREHELTYLGRSGAPEARQIPLSDLWVSIRGKRVVLWSRRHGKRVVPRLTNAHNFLQPGTLTPYRFLSLLQMDGVCGGFAWDWGPLATVPYLPRVRWGRCVLSRATWRAAREEWQSLSSLNGHERFNAVRAWGRKRRLPRLVELVDGDNELLVDFDNPLSVDAFLDLVDDRPFIRLSEMFPSPDDLCVSGPDGTFTHEIYVPVVRPRRAATTQPPVSVPAPEVVSSGVVLGGRMLAPGGCWLFVKVYAGAAEIDRVLTQVVAPLVAEVVVAGIAALWFFVRYADPDHHVRLRFRGDPCRLHVEMLPRLHDSLAPWLASGTVSRVQLDTYQPEVERYGGSLGMDLSEQIFQADSEAVLEMLGELNGDDGADARWRLALRGLEAIVDDFGFQFEEKRALVARRRREYGAEFNVDGSRIRHVLGDRFRQYRRELESLWNRDRDASSELAPGLAIWERRAAKLRPLAAQLRGAESEGRLTVPMATLVDSYLHMFVNRVARAHGRTHELAMFDFLDRHFESLEARARRNAAPRNTKTRAVAVG